MARCDLLAAVFPISSFRVRLKKFDTIAGRFVKQNLVSAVSDDDVIAEMSTILSQRFDLFCEVENLDLYAVPAAGLWIAPIGHGLAGTAGTRLLSRRHRFARESRAKPGAG